MSIGQKDIKILWGRAASLCSMCRKELTEDNSLDQSLTLGEQAHIVAEKVDGPRGISPLTQAERNQYHNLILLCPTDHTKIDKNPHDWPVEELHKIKQAHEDWVKTNLSNKIDLNEEASKIAIACIVDDIIELSDMNNWNMWIETAMSDGMYVRFDFPGSIDRLRMRIQSAIWPEGYEELRASSIELYEQLDRAFNIYEKHAFFDGGMLAPDRFYKNNGYNENYATDLEEFRLWQDEFWDALIESTCAANWFADNVRKYLNPFFHIKTGKFLTSESRKSSFSRNSLVPEYGSQEKILRFIKVQSNNSLNQTRPRFQRCATLAKMPLM